MLKQNDGRENFPNSMSAPSNSKGPAGPAATSAIEQDIGSRFAVAFGTPILAYPWPDSDALNVELRRVILAKEAADSGVTRSNIGGWHSNDDFFLWDNDAVRTLRRRVEQQLFVLLRQTIAGAATRSFNYRIDGWANVNRHQGYNKVHNHPNYLWSGTYYVAPGEPEPGRPYNGKLELLDPRAGVNMIEIEGNLFARGYLVDPLPGLMIMFPSWLKHIVHPFFGTGERISIAFNILIQDATARTTA